MYPRDDKASDDKISPELLSSLTREELIKLVRALENRNLVYKRIIDSQIKPTISELSMFKKAIFLEPIIGEHPINYPPEHKVVLLAPNMPPIQLKELVKPKPGG